MNKQRRKKLEQLKEQCETLMEKLEDILAEEEEYRENIPENLQSGRRCQIADDSCEALSSAVDSLQETISSIEGCI